MEWMRLYARKSHCPMARIICRKPLEKKDRKNVMSDVRPHRTKAKADIGLAKVIADLAAKGCVPCIP
ncbi:MAG: hypothetical protein COS41_03240 [Elusimicrobia bacterium CG03_land_8_20_14_0_80_50_18]|nr:MAG: hypothetical protein COS41_03240 [Elusimicrobia bacterium CG03_land_8_20_14_0_80_50_18]PIX13683.1 MAG: hypothetical protein COZ72_08020 [Elusimicrobia bacterium CG_4_8_14_3_um_filter_50_9]